MRHLHVFSVDTRLLLLLFSSSSTFFFFDNTLFSLDLAPFLFFSFCLICCLFALPEQKVRARTFLCGKLVGRKKQSICQLKEQPGTNITQLDFITAHIDAISINIEQSAR